MTHLIDVLFGFFFTLVASLGLVLTPLRKQISRKLIAAAAFAVPPVLFFTTLCASQLAAVGVDGFLAGDFLCSSLHGGGSHGCGVDGAFFDAIIVASLYSVVSFGLVPLAFFVALLFIFATYKLLRGIYSG